MSDDVWTVGRLLTWTTEWLTGKGSEAPRLEAEVLLAHVRGCQRIALYTAFDTPVAEAERGRFRELVKRRGEGEPVAYLVGSREFFSLPFRVTPAVLVPRPETEGLVIRVLDLCRPQAGPRIVDVGTGSGAIAITLAKHLPKASITATDVSSAALAVARDNAARQGVAERIEFLECDLLDHPQAAGPWDVIVSNPPYVREDEFESLPRDVRLHEPKAALVSGPTGVEIIERLAALAAARLVPGGWLLCEIGPAAAAEAVLARQTGLTAEPTILDFAGLPRIVQARRR
ncbi:MAG: peptide chain release factor N(5)-glutamine methyltransferase [Planctomycetia bacterium]|jgi:release factor glutamine methyltransferase|nr:peptide chain release factor N(5)-glutamine methyltransferase [Planctomycetia bacterium]